MTRYPRVGSAAWWEKEFEEDSESKKLRANVEKLLSELEKAHLKIEQCEKEISYQKEVILNLSKKTR